MLVVDDILFFPARGLYWVFKQIHSAVLEEQSQTVEKITHQLSELYMQLETGRITEEEFDELESVLLDQLDELEEAQEEDEFDEEEYDQDYDDDEFEYDDVDDMEDEDDQ